MTYGGAGEAGIHATQLSVSASLLNAGQDIEEVVALLLEATARAAGDLGSRWNWRKEEVSAPPDVRDVAGEAPAAGTVQTVRRTVQIVQKARDKSRT